MQSGFIVRCRIKPHRRTVSSRCGLITNAMVSSMVCYGPVVRWYSFSAIAATPTATALIVRPPEINRADIGLAIRSRARVFPACPVAPRVAYADPYVTPDNINWHACVLRGSLFASGGIRRVNYLWRSHCARARARFLVRSAILLQSTSSR